MNRNGVDIIAEEWDTLIILDACRYDLFVKEHPFEGDLQFRISRGSATNEWLKANLADRQLHNLVYVTANPMYLNNAEKFDLDLHAIIDVEPEELEDGAVAKPDTVTDVALTAHDNFPNKRILVHYVQPHYPFLRDDAPIRAEKAEGKQNIWNQLVEATTSVDPESVRKAYLMNLRPAIPHVQRLIESIEGLTVVSSDHGNMLGERSRPVPTIEWGHPQGIYTEQLVRVPWLVCSGGKRRQIVNDDPIRFDHRSTKVNERLANLGYI